MTGALTEEQKKLMIKAILKSLEKGSSIRKSCEAAGVSTVAFWKWRRDNKDLEEKVKEIQEANIMEVEDAVFISARDGDSRAQEFYLTNRAPDRWKKRLYNQLANPDDTALLSGLKTVPDAELERRILEMFQRLKSE
jgi:hypothetical protein